MQNKIQRNSAFEVMRLIAMFMVILGHCMLTTAQDTEPYLGKLDLTGWGIGAFIVCAVNLFFLLSGYFVRSENFKLSRVIDIWAKSIFYSFVIYIVISFITSSFDLKTSITFLTPIFSKQYWYMQTYIVVALIMPFIAKGLENLSNRQLTFLVVILFVFFSIHQTFIKVAYTLDQTQGYGFIWACVMLTVGYWLRKNSKTICKLSAMLYLAGYILISVMIFISNYLIVRLDIAGGVTSRGNFYAYNSVTVLLQSLCLFCFFIVLSKKNLHMPAINYLSKNVLAGYLISAHPLLLYPIWQKYLNMGKYTENIVVYIGLSIVFTILILLGCIFIDKIIEKIFKFFGMEKLKYNVNRLYTKHIDSKEQVDA